MPIPELSALKRVLRQEALARRAERHAAGAAKAVAARDLGLPPDVEVAGYSAIGTELDPASLMQALAKTGHPLSLPVVTGRDEALDFRRYGEGDLLHPGPFGTRHPAPEAERVRPAVLLVPLLAFDRKGFRLGYGGGYYDRTLRALRAQGPLLAIGIAFAFQEMPSLPHDALDERLDMIVTERGVLRFGMGE